MTAGSNWSLFASVLCVNFITFISGASYSWTSPVLPQLAQTDNPLGRRVTVFEQSWIAAILNLGASAGPFLAGALVCRIGRKKTMLLLALPVIVSYLTLAFATNIALYYFSRFLLGIGLGCNMTVIPMYVGEIAEKSNRGALGCLMGVMTTLGLCYSYIVGPFVSIQVLCLTFLCPAFAFLVLYGLFGHESPYYLIMTGGEECEKAARIVLTKLRRGSVDKEFEEIKDHVKSSKRDLSNFGDLIKSNVVRKSLLIGLGLMFFQQASGITAINSYMQSIFVASGGIIKPSFAPMIVSAFQMMTNLITTQTIDRLGRRVLLMTSLTVMLVSHVLLGVYFYLQSKQSVSFLSWLPLCSAILYIVSYTSGMGPVVFVMVGELFPPHVRATGSTCATFVCLIMAFALSLLFPNLVDKIGMAYSFWIFAGSCAVGLLFVWNFAPETKGKNLHDIQRALENNGV